MNATSSTTGPGTAYVLRYARLFNPGRGYAFPCDRAGHVDLDTLSESGRASYFYARAVVGRDLSYPVVAPVRGAGSADADVLA